MSADTQGDRLSLIEREWLLHPGDYDGDAEAPEGHERLIAVGPPVVGPNLAVVPASQLRGAVALLHRALPYLIDLDEMLNGEGPGLLARAIEAEFPTERGQ